MSGYRVFPACRTMAGYILLPVTVTLTILAAVGFLMNREVAMGLSAARGDYEADRARYIAEAGLHHTLFKLSSDCSGTGADLTDEPFDGGTYTTVVTPAGANRVDVTATGTLPGGTSRSLSRQGIVLTGSSTANTFQPGPGGKDVTVDSRTPSTNHGAGTRLEAHWQGSHRAYALLMFDLAAIPSGAQIDAARLELYLDSYSSLESASRFTAFRMLTPWVEDAATWSTSDGSTAWSWPGAYDSATPLDTTPPDPSYGGWHSWDMTSTVQGWHAGTLTNAGVVITGNDYVWGALFVSGEDADASRWPRLIVDYSCQCGQTCEIDHYRDEFTTQTCDESVDYAGSDGSLDWTPWTWIEEGEGGAPCSGGVRVETDSFAPGGYVLRFNDAGKALRREADLTSFSNVMVRFDYRRDNLDDPTDGLEVAVSADGSAWSVVGQILGPGTDTAYQRVSYDIGAHAGGPVHLRLKSLGLSAPQANTIYVDSVEIRDEAGSGPPPPPQGTPVEADALVDEWEGPWNHGADPTLRVGKHTGSGKLIHSVLRFDLSSIPAGSTVSAATLRLYQVGASGSGTVTMPLYHVNTPWTELGVVWDNVSDGGIVHATTDVALGTTGWFEWDLPPGLIHEWIDGITPNDGVVIKPSGASKGQIADFASREHATPGIEPELIIVYTPP